ncbi:MAG: zinc-ribbon domain-containing protein [Deltaproteobacteria bacterium]|nr:zinc-ribbon domain-containing protein [Deltaproteobacteria bacterium]
MEVVCESCQARFNVPDDKIPAGKSIRAACPKCKNKITIPATDDAASPAPAGKGTGEEAYDAAEKPFDFIEEDALTALICEPDPAIRDKVASVLELMEYHLTTVSSTREALKKMRYHNYNVVVVNESFDTSTPETNGVLLFLERLPMTTRRELFVCLITSRYRTMDHMLALNKSVNMILNVKNINDFGKILSTAITENDIFYRAYKETAKLARGF